MVKRGGLFKACTLTREWCLVAGRMKKPEIVRTESVDEVLFVEVSKRASWLCEAVAGRPARDRPLVRTTLLDDLRGRCLSERQSAPTADADDKMQALLDDDAAPGETRKRKRRRHIPKPNAVVVVAVPDPASARAEPRPASARAEPRRTIRLLDKARAVWIDAESLPWLIASLKDEYELTAPTGRRRSWRTAMTCCAEWPAAVPTPFCRS